MNVQLSRTSRSPVSEAVPRGASVTSHATVEVVSTGASPLLNGGSDLNRSRRSQPDVARGREPAVINSTHRLRKQPMVIGSWNVRTLLDSKSSGRPQRRTALVASELARYNVDIAALSETRLPDSGQLAEAGQGYTFFWSGRRSSERRESGVGFAIKSELASKLAKLPEQISDRLMTLRLPLKKNRFVTIISAYAPTMTNPDSVKKAFYEDLETAITKVPRSEKLLVLGDFNARVGTDHETWAGTIGRHGVGRCNSNGLLLLQTCAAHNLVVTNTAFRQPTRRKTTWMHPRSKQWHLIDYVITRSNDLKDVRVTKAMCGAECWTDHRLLVSKLDFQIQPRKRPQGQKIAKRINQATMNEKQSQERFAAALDCKILQTQDNDSSSIEEKWEDLKRVIHETALAHFEPAQRRNQDWFDENDAAIQDLLTTKRNNFKSLQSDPSSAAKKAAYKRSRGEAQKQLRVMQNSWLTERAHEIQRYADQKDSKRFYEALKCLYGPQASGTTPIRNLNGSSLLTEKSEILERWTEHFSNILNRPSTINAEAIEQLPQVEINPLLDNQITGAEIEVALSQLSRGKSPGSDAIPADVYKAGGPAMRQRLTTVFQAMWDAEQLPQDFKDATVVHIYKHKGDRHSCDNHRGIALLSSAGKILARVLLNRLLKHLEQGLLPESQSGFRKARGTTDMIFSARQLQEKCQEQNIDLYTVFIDLTKAFDYISRDGLWKIMAKFGCSRKFINVIRQFHDGMKANILENGDLSPAFPVTNGVKQGCVLAPTLFSMVFSAMLTDAFKTCDQGVNIRYRTDGKLFNIRRFNAPTKVRETTVRDLLFADDCGLNGNTEPAMQQLMDCFSRACDNFGLSINTQKTEIMYQPAPGKIYERPHVTVNGETLNAVDNFTYLGSNLSRSVHIDNEINIRIAKASAAFSRLRKNVWERRGIANHTKLMVYRAVVLPTLLYASETWTIHARHTKQLNSFHMSRIRKILHIYWQAKLSDTEVLKLANIPSIYTLLQKSQVRWAGHVVRMPDNRLPKQLLYGELKSGRRNRAKPKKRWKDSLKESLKKIDIDANNWETLATDRAAWRAMINSQVNEAEDHRVAAAERKRSERKTRAANSIAATNDHLCQHCDRSFRARIGLISHLRTHITQGT